MNKYTVVLEWYGDTSADVRVVHVEADNLIEAWDNAYRSIWDVIQEYTDDIPADAEYSNEYASDAMYAVATFPGHIEEATA